MGNLFAIYFFKYFYDNAYYSEQPIEHSKQESLFTAESEQFSPLTYSKLKADEERRLVNFKQDLQYESSRMTVSIPNYKG